MKSLTEYINESFLDGKLDTSINKRELNKVLKAIYNAVQKSGVTAHMYHDQSWEGVKAVRTEVQSVLDKLSDKLTDGSKYEVSIAPDDGGYRTSKDGMSQWKQYKVELFKVPAKYEDYPEPFQLGYLNCFAAGTVEDPFKSYDMSLTF